MKLIKIISGGQNGVDQAGLFVAKYLGFETGGWMPKGWKTLDGPRPKLAQMYGMQEHKSPAYPPRTHLNVKESTGTVRLYTTDRSPGEICTLNAILKYKKPHFNVDLNQPPDPEKFIWFLKKHEIEILNVAGNSENTSPGITQSASMYLYRALHKYRSR